MLVMQLFLSHAQMTVLQLLKVSSWQALQGLNGLLYDCQLTTETLYGRDSTYLLQGFDLHCLWCMLMLIVLPLSEL